MGEFDLTLGPILMGTLIATLLLGIMIVQSYNYFTISKSDALWMKLIVLFVLCIDCLSTALDMYWIYFYVITNFGNIAATKLINSVSGVAWPVLTGITAFVVQGVFARRIHILIKLRPLTITILVLSTVQLLASIGTTIAAHDVGTFSRIPQIEPVVLVWMLSSVVTDAIITVALVWWLRIHKTGLKNTDTFVDRLVRLTLQTGLLTTTFALLVVIMDQAEPASMALAFGLPLSKIYTNSLVSTLNARKYWELENPSGVKISSLQFAPNPRNNRELQVGASVMTTNDVRSQSNSESYELESISKSEQLFEGASSRRGEVDNKASYSVV